MNYSIPGFPVLHYLLGLVKFVSTKSVMSFSHLILCCPLLLLPSIVLSNRVFSNESALRIWWPSTGASASASVLPVSIQGWFPLRLTDLPAVPGTLKSLLHHHNLKSSILWHSAIFTVQFLHLNMTPGKTIALTIQTCWQDDVSGF